MGWYNADGLYVKFSTEEAAPGLVGGYNTRGPRQMIEVFLSETKLTGLSATAGATVLDYNAVLPKNSHIEKITVIAEKACTGVGAVLNLGLIKTDLATELDYNGLVAAIPLASVDTIGETTELVVGSTYAGALIGTVLTENGYFVADYDTAAFTAGSLRIRIEYTRDLT